jgi:trans-aconitate methyltransferase
MRTAADLGIGGGAVALALVDRLVAKNILTPDDAKAILADAQKRAMIFPDGVEGARVVGEIYASLTKAGG